MNIKDFKSSLDYLFQSEITPFVWGHAGIGKSTIVREYANKKGFHFFPLYLGTQSDVGDILGLAAFRRDADGNDEATRFATPEWLQDAIKYCNDNPASGAIIFLDEFNRGRRDVLNGMFSLALDKTFHTVKLPKNCHIIAAGNPPTDEYFTTDVNEAALMARFVHIKLEPSFEEWLNYAQSTNFDSSIIGFLNDQPELIEEKRQTFELPVKIDRRCWSKIDALKKLNPPENILEQLMIGIIGVERVVAYKEYLKKLDKALTAEEILKGHGFDKLEAWTIGGDIKASLLNTSCNNIQDYMTKNETLDKSESDNLMKFIKILPKEVAYALFRNLIDKNSNSFREFSKNPDYEVHLVEIAKTAKGIK